MSELEIVLEYFPITLRKEIISNIGTEENNRKWTGYKYKLHIKFKY